MGDCILALDQGTTSSRAILFDQRSRLLATAQEELEQSFPSPGHVEHDATEIWISQLKVARQAIHRAQVDLNDIRAIGVANQRETIVVWERGSGRPVAPAVVWQSRITAPFCRELEQQGHATAIREKTGLLIDPYFSGTKIKWLLDKLPRAREKAQRGEWLCGTIDSYLIYRLTKGERHITDVSNASRTMLLNIHSLDWDDELLELFDVPREMMPQVVASSGDLGTAAAEWFGRPLPITGCAGDQQAATFGQACFQVGDAKNTYGTGCFLLVNLGDTPRLSEHRLLTTVGWQIDGETTYCLEGSVFIAGALFQWMRDQLGLIDDMRELERLAKKVPDSDGVVIVPAFVGLGAPHWDPQARGTIFGLNRGTSKGHLARAAMEAVALQIVDLAEAMVHDLGTPLATLRVDGGASVDSVLMQIQADLLGASLKRPPILETTALGAAYLAGLQVGIWSGKDEIAEQWKTAETFEPRMPSEERQRIRSRWRRALERSFNWESD